MKKWLLLLLPVLFMACKKDKSKDFYHGDIWVETTLRRDTMEFNSPLASSTNSIYFSSPQYDSGYHYFLKTDSILLKSFASSSPVFKAYYFIQNSSTLFTIGNFFQRTSLPGIVQFKKIK